MAPEDIERLSGLGLDVGTLTRLMLEDLMTEFHKELAEARKRGYIEGYAAGSKDMLTAAVDSLDVRKRTWSVKLIGR